MIKKISRNELRKIRHKRIRKKIKGTSLRPRCNIFKSNKHIYLQVIDDTKGITLAYANSLEKDLREKKLKFKEIVEEVANRLAARCKEKNIKKLVFDRGGYKYHGNVKKVAEILRQNGLEL
ncbi:MAG: 50S ribosomal protein L18 [bacterium]|jgi:large subunit ribosomal protein L18